MEAGSIEKTGILMQFEAKGAVIWEIHWFAVDSPR